MTSHLHQLRLDGKVEFLDDQRVLVLTLGEGAISDFTLGLCLLEENLVAGLGIRVASSKTVLELRCGTGVHRARGSASRGGISLELSETELRHWLVFFLKCIRDGRAEVDHIDVEVDSNDAATPEDLIIKVPHSAPTVSPEEARRRLEL